MAKRGRDLGEGAGASYCKNPHMEIAFVNPFELMMQAARNQRDVSKPAAEAVANAGAVPCAPCTHCGRQQQLPNLQQCQSCQDVFCGMCSTLNYEERDVRVFCFECNEEVCRAAHHGVPAHHGSAMQHHACCATPLPGAGPGGAHHTASPSPFPARPSPFSPAGQMPSFGAAASPFLGVSAMHASAPGSVGLCGGMLLGAASPLQLGVAVGMGAATANAHIFC